MEEQESIRFLTLIHLPVSDINCSKYLLRRDIELNLPTKFIDSLQQYGITQPLAVEKLKDDKYYLVSGFRRFSAAKELGIKTVPCYLVEGYIAPLLGFFENEHHLELTTIERSESIRKFCSIFECSQKDCADLLKISPQTLSDELKISALPQRIKDDAVNSKIVPKRDLIKISRINDPGKQWESYQNIKAEKLGKGRRKSPIKRDKTLNDITQKIYQITSTLISTDQEAISPKEKTNLMSALKNLNTVAKKLFFESDASGIFSTIKRLFKKVWVYDASICK